MKLLFILPSSSGTIAKVSYNLYKAIKTLTSAEVFVLIFDDKIEDNAYDFGDQVFVFPKSKYKGIIRSFKSISFLTRIKKRFSIEVSISTLLACNIYNALSRGTGKTIGIFHSPIYQIKVLGYFKYILCVVSCRLFLKKLDRIIAVSETVKEDLEKYTKKYVEVVYNIIDFKDITEKSNNDILEEDKLLVVKPYILYVGALYDIKGPDRLIKAFKQSLLYNKYNLIFIGSDFNNSEEKYKNLVYEEDLKDKVFFIGTRGNPYPYMKKACFLVSPSRSEGLPTVIIESLYLKCPVVACNSSRGVFEIMECPQLYKINLNENIETKYGFITPNLSDDEQTNVELLAKAMIEMTNKDQIEFDFDYSRFSDEVIVNKLVNCK